MTTNTEFLKDKVENRILHKIRHLDSCLKFDGVECDYIFFEEDSGEVSEVSFKYDNIIISRYNFLQLASKILKTKTENRLVCVDWTSDEFTILKHLLQKHGIVGYSIDDFVTSTLPTINDDFNPSIFDILTFSDVSDMAMFEVYFQKLFDHEYDKKYLDLLKKNGVLE